MRRREGEEGKTESKKEKDETIEGKRQRKAEGEEGEKERWRREWENRGTRGRVRGRKRGREGRRKEGAGTGPGWCCGAELSCVSGPVTPLPPPLRHPHS